MSATCGFCSVDVTLKVLKQSQNSLLISIIFQNNTSEKIVLDGFNWIDFEDYLIATSIERNSLEFKTNTDHNTKVGDIKDTIALNIPITMKKLRYQKLYNGDTLDVFKEFSFLRDYPFMISPNPIDPPPPPQLPKNDSVGFSWPFLDMNTFTLLWNDSVTYNHNNFGEYEDVYLSYYLITLEPYSSKEVILDLDYLLCRKATYILQVCDNLNKNNFDKKMVFKKRYGYKPYYGALQSNVLTIVSE